jgi:hypothetical protein
MTQLNDDTGSWKIPVDGRVRFITHKGKQILLVDCTNCSADELENVARIVPTYVTAEPLASLLLLADFTGSKFDRKMMETMKQGLVYDRPHLKRSAWVGTENLPNVFYEHLKVFSRRDLPTFPTREEAMDWLVTE